MAVILRQSTAIDVRIGPFVDVGDGFTPEVGITLGAADEAEALKANGAATASIAAATWAAVAGCDGWYDLTLTASHTDTVGELVIVVQDDSECLPVFQRFQVIEEAIYDALYVAAADGFDANGRVDVALIEGTDATDQIRDSVVDDSTRLDGSALNGLAGNDPGAQIASQADVTALNDPTAAAIAAAVWATQVEVQGTYTAQQVLSIVLAAVAGVTSSNGAVLETPDGVANRITATINAVQERTAMVLNPSA